MRGCTATFLVITFVVAGFMGTLNKRTCSSPITVVLKAQSDNYVSENNPTSCYGSEVVLNVRSYFDGQNHNNHRTYIYFDINLIPENVKILSALLWLYKNPEGANPGVRDILAFRVADAWDEYTQNWDTQPNVSQKPTASSKVDGPLKWYSWNLTQDVTAWYDGSAFNYGTMLRDAAENSRTDYASIFLSREASHPENPYLQVEYIESAESTAATSGELKEGTPSGYRSRAKKKLSRVWSSHSQDCGLPISNPRQRPSEKLPPSGKAFAHADSNASNVALIAPIKNLSVLSDVISCSPSFLKPPSSTRTVTNRNDITAIRIEVIRLRNTPNAKPPTPPTPTCARSGLRMDWSISKLILLKYTREQTMKGYWRCFCIDQCEVGSEIYNSR